MSDYVPSAMSTSSHAIHIIIHPLPSGLLHVRTVRHSSEVLDLFPRENYVADDTKAYLCRPAYGGRCCVPCRASKACARNCYQCPPTCAGYGRRMHTSVSTKQLFHYYYYIDISYCALTTQVHGKAEVDRRHGKQTQSPRNTPTELLYPIICCT